MRYGSLLSLVAVTGCFGDSHDATAPTSAATPAIESAKPPVFAEDDLADDADVVARRASFAPCAEDPELECGQLSVPADYANPHGPQITLGTVRAPATRAGKQGVIFVNPGGPGGSGVDLVILAKPLFTQLRERFDIVSFDPRGTARSQPVDCAIELPAPPAADTMEANAAFFDELGARYAQACHDQHGALATQVGTKNVARDIDRFRAALGERQVNYLGYSYGTILGATYATLFPHRVRAMVLDANLTPAWYSDYLVELDADGSAGAELALRRIDQLCRAAADCPLRTAGVVATYDRVLARLTQNPVSTDGGVIDGTSLRAQVFGALYNDTGGWPFIVRTLHGADAGDYTGLPPHPVDVGSTAMLPSFFAILCDDSATRRVGRDYLPARTATQAVFPRFAGANVDIGLAACSAWPRTRNTPVAKLRTPNPVVLLGNDFDPATPMAWSRNLATALGEKAALIRYQGGGHGIYLFGSPCIDAAVDAYLQDPTAAPRGLTCPAQPIAFGASLQRAAATPNMAEVLERVTPSLPGRPQARMARGSDRVDPGDD